MSNKYLFISFLIVLLLIIPLNILGQTETSHNNRVLRTAIHVFQDSTGNGNFSADSSRHVEFLQSIINRVNHQFANLDSMKPAFSSPYIKDIGVSLLLDTIYYTIDYFAWNSDSIIQSQYIDSVYVANNSSLNYDQKHKTLHIFLTGNYNVVGGHVSDIGDKRYIATRGFFNVFKNRTKEIALSLCWRNLIHETGHALGLKHNFSGGPSGDQCDDCDDNGCPEEGSSNNIMDYWPGYGFALSQCQKEIINAFLSGQEGNISHIVLNDSCYIAEYLSDTIYSGEKVIWSGLRYIHSNIVVEKGASLLINGTISFQQDCSLIIEAGARVVVDNARLTNLCGDLWNGIILLGNSYLTQENSDNQPFLKIMNNAIIENSKTGIIGGSEIYETGEILNSGGGIIEAESCLFRNNLISVKFLPYAKKNKSFFRSCSFEITRFPNHFEEGYRPEEIISLFGIRGIDFSNNTFYNSIDDDENYVDRGIGIFSMDASYTVNNNVFNGLFYGIRALAGNKMYRPEMNYNSFINNFRGIYLSGVCYSIISNNYFELRRNEHIEIYGLHLDNCTDYIVEDNRFTSVFGGGEIAGTIISGSGRTDDLLYNNEYQNLAMAFLLQAEEKSPAIRQTSFNKIDIDVLINSDNGKGMGFANKKYTQSQENFTQFVNGGYNTYYRSDHIPVYFKAFENMDANDFIIPDNLFFSDPFSQVINLPDPNPANLSYSFLLDIFEILDYRIDSLTFQLESLKDEPEYISNNNLIIDVGNPTIPPVILLKEIIDNPRSTGIQEVKNSLEERFGDLPTYMLKNIERVSSSKSRHEIISDKIKMAEITKHQYLLRSLIHSMYDSDLFINDSLNSYLDLDNSSSVYIKRVFKELHNMNFESINDLLEIISNQVNVNEEYSDFMIEYISYLKLLYDVGKDQRTYFELKEEEKNLLDDLKDSRFSEISCLGSNIYNFVYNIIPTDEVYYPEVLYTLNKPVAGPLPDNDILRVYPNPARGMFMIDFESTYKPLSNYHLEIIDSWGHKMDEISLNNLNNQIIYTDNFQSGLYFCRLISGGEPIAIKKIIILKH